MYKSERHMRNSKELSVGITILHPFIASAASFLSRSCCVWSNALAAATTSGSAFRLTCFAVSSRRQL